MRSSGGLSDRPNNRRSRDSMAARRSVRSAPAQGVGARIVNSPSAVSNRNDAPAARSMAALPFAFAIFLGAFLLFQVQPLIGKYVLPWFGGATAVWTACMLFFQAVLLAGYAYAHLSSRYLSARMQMFLHILLLVAALCVLPIAPSGRWKPSSGDDPTLGILMLLLACV